MPEGVGAFLANYLNLVSTFPEKSLPSHVVATSLLFRLLIVLLEFVQRRAHSTACEYAVSAIIARVEAITVRWEEWLSWILSRFDWRSG